MNKYSIQHRIHTLLHNAAGKSKQIAEFTYDNIIFRQEGFSMIHGWRTNYWIASGEIEANSGIDAINIFRKKLDTIICALCLVGQAYAEYATFSSLVTRDGLMEALFFYYEENDGGKNLMISPEHISGVDVVLKDKRDFSYFLKYWREVVNTPDYIARLILACSAIDALTKSLSQNDWEEEKHELREKILGEDLKEKLYGNRKYFADARRHKLIHGEMGSDLDEVKTMIEIQNKIIDFFNKEVFGKDIMSKKIINPLRNPYKNFASIGRVIRFTHQQQPLSVLEQEYKDSNPKGVKMPSFTYLSPDENNRLSAEF